MSSGAPEHDHKANAQRTQDIRRGFGYALEWPETSQIVELQTRGVRWSWNRVGKGIGLSNISTTGNSSGIGCEFGNVPNTNLQRQLSSDRSIQEVAGAADPGSRKRTVGRDISEQTH